MKWLMTTRLYSQSKNQNTSSTLTGSDSVLRDGQGTTGNSRRVHLAGGARNGHGNPEAKGGVRLNTSL